jgi:histidinol phosphatase-like enzyme
VFLDRDRVLIEDFGHISRPEQVHLIGESATAVARLNHSEYRAVVVTNQPVIARGEATVEDLRRIHARLDMELAKGGGYLDALYYCNPPSG